MQVCSIEQEEIMDEPDVGAVVRQRGPWFRVMDPNTFNTPLQCFDETPGPIGFTANLSPCQYFMKFTEHNDEDLLEKIVTETNRYAEQCIQRAENNRRHGIGNQWTPVNKEEMMAFLGLYMSMGIIKKPSYRSYWETNREYDLTDTPNFSTIMSRNRFQAIMKFIHCNNNDAAVPRGDAGYDPLHKITPVIEFLNGSFSSKYKLGQHVAIDERVVGFKGRHHLKQYIANKKKHRWGAKIWVLADSATGYTHQIHLYKGRFNNINNPNGLGYGVVTKLMEPHLNKNHHVSIDRFFTSPALFHYLFEQRTFATGTVLASRKGMPQSFKTLRLPRNEVVVKFQGSLMAMLWSDRRQVVMLSTTGSPRFTNERNTKGKIRNAPGIIHLYNRNMGGIDLGDQLIGQYDPDFRGVKMWRKILFNLIMTIAVNAYIVYNRSYLVQRKMSHMEFQMGICRGLIGTYRGGRPVQPRLRNLQTRLTDRHFIELIPASKRKQCLVCSSKVRTWCPDCRVGLCLSRCFRRYHTMVNPREE